MIGMEFFANKLLYNPLTKWPIRYGVPGYETAYIPQYNFNTFLWAFVTVYSTLTFDIWHVFFYDCYIAVGWSSAFYFIALVFLGGFLFQRFFLAALIQNFISDDVLENVDQQPKSILKACCRLSRRYFKNAMGRFSFENPQKKKKRKQAKQENPFTEFWQVHVRAPLVKMICNNRFEGMVLAAIFINTTVLCAQNPLVDPKSQDAIALKLLDTVLVLFFGIEVIVRIIAYGAFDGPEAYFYDNWNLLDFLVSVISCVGLFHATGLFLNVISMVRSLRPLRLVRRMAGLKHIVTVMLESLPTMINAILVCSFCILIFSVFAVSFQRNVLFMQRRHDSRSASFGHFPSLLGKPKPVSTRVIYQYKLLCFRSLP